MKKIVSLVTSCVLLVSIFAGCGKSEPKKNSGQTTIRFATWDTEDKLNVQKELVQKFEEANPDIKVELEAYGDNFDTKIAAGFGAGDAPDVMYMWNYPMYKDGLEPLDDWMKKDTDFKKDNFYEALFNYNSIDNVTYGLPIGYTTHAVYYNKKIFDDKNVPYPKEDWTWDDFVEIAKKISDPDKKQYGFVFPMEPDPYDFEHYLWGNGTEFIGDDKKLEGHANSAKSIDVFTRFQNMVKNNIAIVSEGGGLKEIKSGLIGMYVSGAWAIKGLKDENIDFGVVQLPRFQKDKKSVSVVNSSGMAIYNKSQNKEAAWKFIKFYTSEEANKIRIKTELPVLKNVAESEKLVDDPIYSVFYKMLEQSEGHVPSSFKVDNWSEFNEKISQATSMIFNPEVSADPKSTLDTMVK
ncbi:ABC transporter substrate-binding protein [Clostridium amazonitimonense]|uniref:ABC transporter substrate-binding protein n=1 Tax=Clostridium amazonitimonense TaxID=1499689 RepID=UPI0005095371|nr:sugar ABC transporter substrate-binding protein [Clostridium amazonitimonense]